MLFRSCLELEDEDGELPLELLPELQELTYFGTGGAFNSFIETRQNADRPITLVRRRPTRATPDSIHIASERSERSKPSSITRVNSEAGNDFDS